MRVLIFGPTGGTGRELVAQAAARGHAVTAFARTPSKLSAPAAVSVVKGDVLGDAAALTAAVKDAAPDAVLVSLGGNGIWSRDYNCSRGTENILSAIKAAGATPRVIVCSSMGVGDSASLIPSFVGWLLKHALADKDPQEAAVRASGLPYTIVRPTGLRDAPARGVANVTALVCAKLPTSAIARADVAAYMLDAVSGDALLNKTVGISWTSA